MQTAEDFLGQYEPTTPQTAESFLSQYEPDTGTKAGVMLHAFTEGAYSPFKPIVDDSLEALKNAATATGQAVSEPLNSPTANGAMAIPDAIVRTVGKAGNAIGGVYGALTSLPTGALAASAEPLIPAEAKGMAALTGQNPNLSPEQVHQLAMQQGSDLANATMMGKAGVQGEANVRQQQGLPPAPKPYDPLQPAWDKLQAMSENNAPRQGFLQSNSSDPMAPPSINLDTQGLHDLSQQLYRKGATEGGFLNEDMANNFVDKINQIQPQQARVKALAGDSEATKLIEGLQSWRDKPISFEEADELDKLLTKKMTAPGVRNPITGELNAEGNDLADIQHAFRETMQEAPDQPGFETNNAARKTWSAYLKQKQIDQIVDNAELTDNPANALKTGFRGLARKLNKNSAGWSDEELSAVRSAAKSGIIGGTLRFASSRMIPLISALTGGTEAGGIGLGLNEASKALNNKLQMNRANNVMDAVANRPEVQKAYQIANTPTQKTGFSMIPTPPELPAPPAPLALPAPQPEMIPSNEPYTSPSGVAERPYSGQMRLQTPQERDAAIAMRQNPDAIAALNARADQTPESVLNTELRQKQNVIENITAWRKAAKALSDKGFTHKEIVNQIGERPLPPE